MLDDARLIRREVDRCRAILGRLRLDVEDAAPPRGVVRVDELVANLRDNLQEPEASRLEVRRSADVESVNAPGAALEQALLVLVRNAFDASPAGRPVTLEVSRRRDGRVRFDVRDRGSGMSEQVLRRAGEPFFTTKGPRARNGARAVPRPPRRRAVRRDLLARLPRGGGDPLRAGDSGRPITLESRDDGPFMS